MVLAALLHDYCKAGLYEVSMRNVKNAQGQWVQEPFYKVKDPSPACGHGGESLRRIEKSVWLGDAWAQAVYWHMGAMSAFPDDRQSYMDSCKVHREVLALHTADMLATCEGV
jgi:hypothetical protein